MGCQQSTAVRPSDVYDTESVAADSGVSSLEVDSAEKVITSEPSSLQRRQSIFSVDSGMEAPSMGTDSFFKDIPHYIGVSVDTSRAKTNGPVVSMCSQRLGFDEFPDGRRDGQPCTIYWHSLVHNDMKTYIRGPDSRVNKFPGMTDLAKKVSLTRAIRSMRELFPEEYDFYPKSWILPAQAEEFKTFSQKTSDRWFIAKPDDGCQGTGIHLLNRWDQLQTGADRILIQEYVDDPYLLPDKLKFDFRVYAVVRNLNPLSIYIAREGMARFCTERYAKPTAGNFSRLYSHLTNYSLNKNSSSYIHSNSLKDQMKGSKRLLSTVFYQMEQNGVRTRKLWHDIKIIIVKTVLAMVPELMINYEHYFSDVPGPQCFQIMGFDIIVKEDGTPLLLEVNSAPSLTIDHTSADGNVVRSIVDEMIKVPLVRDCLLLVLNEFNETNSSLSNEIKQFERESNADKRKRKPHLSEIFPARYGQNSKHLLILDRAVYLFIQFVNIKLTQNITLMGARAFIKKCNLSDVVSSTELEQTFSNISYYFTGQKENTSGLPFHGFLRLLFRVANMKFSFCDDQLAALQRLFAFCDTSLRHYGIRSTRLRRTEVETDENTNSVEIYLLPNRMRKKSGRHQKQIPTNTQISNGIRRNRSVPRFQNPNTTHLPSVTVVR